MSPMPTYLRHRWKITPGHFGDVEASTSLFLVVFVKNAFDVLSFIGRKKVFLAKL